MQIAPDLPQITAQLAAYSAELARCIGAQRWTETNAILLERQQYFEALAAHAETLKAAGIGEAIQDMLLEDEVFITNILEQKHQLEREHLALVRGRQAIKAYE